MKLVYHAANPKDWDVDIIAVHGLSEAPRETWIWTPPSPDPSHSEQATNTSKGPINKIKHPRQSGSSHGRPASATRDQSQTAAPETQETSNVAPQVAPISDLGASPPASGGPLPGTTELPKIKTPQEIMRERAAREQRRNEVRWLQDLNMLPKAFPKARIYRYGYQWNPGTLEDINNKTTHKFLSDLIDMRKQNQDRKPILFIGHGYGGIVIESALNSAKKHWNQKSEIEVTPDKSPPSSDISYSDYQDITSSTVGVIFLATPFRPNYDVLHLWERLGIAVPKAPKMAPAILQQPNEPKVQITIETSSLTAPLFIKSTNIEFVRLVKEEGFRVWCFYALKKSSDSKLGTVIQTTHRDYKLLTYQ